MSAKVLVWTVLLPLLCAVCCADPPPPGQADPISLDRISPSVLNFGNLAADIYGEAGGPAGFGWDLGGPGPILHIAAATYGLGNADNNDGHSLGHNNPNWIPIVYFSASRRSKGMWNTQYRHQAVRNQAAGDRFVTNGWMSISPAASYASGTQANLMVWLPGMGPNLLSANQTRYNEIPSIPPGAVNPIPDPNQIDEMDALELHQIDLTGEHVHSLAIFFSLDPASPSMPAGGSAADIFISPPGVAGFGLWASAASMGLQTTDDIDALVVFNVSGEGEAVPGTDYALFSLKPGNSLGADPSAVYVTCFQGISRLYFIGPTIGLLRKDNLDGLDIEQYVDGQNLPQVFDELVVTIPPPPDPMWPAREYPNGTTVNVSGIVTLIGADFLYIEAPDSSSGIRVETIPPWYVEPGDDLQVIGTLGLLDGERVITPPDPCSPISSGNPIPELFGMRAHDVGGRDLDALNPGVTNGRGPLNVGLLVNVSGMVTARDPASDPQWFYVWDGSNMWLPGMGIVPLQDGSGNYGVRVVSDRSFVPWTDWVSVTGVVSTNAAAVTGKVIPEILPYDGPWMIDSFFDVYADPGTVLGIPKKNLISLTCAPANVGLGDPAGLQPWEASQIFPPGRTQDEIDGRLIRWETVSRSSLAYDMWAEPNGQFGGILLGDGYWLTPEVDWPLSYSATPSTLAQWIATGPAGWRMIGHPQESPTPMEDLFVHSGREIKTAYDASQYGDNWFISVGIFWDNLLSSSRDVGLPDDWAFDDSLRPWHGYWFMFLEDNKAFIVPGEPKFEFFQLDFDLDDVIVTDSEWGWVALTFSGSPNVQYFNLIVDGSWVAENVPVLSVKGVGVPQTLYIDFNLGVPRGTDVSSLQYFGSLTTSTWTNPYAPSSVTAPVTAQSVIMDSGTKGEAIVALGVAPLLVGAQVVPGPCASIATMPNQECPGVGKCVPTAVSNSLKYLNSTFSLGLTDAQTSEGTMETATGYDPSPPPGCYSTWPTTKGNYMTANGYGITTSTTNNLDDAATAIANGYDVELRSPTHCATVTGIVKQADGKYSITVSHDTDQTGPGGTKTQTVIYDPATGKFSGGAGFDGQTMRPIVIEKPS